ncbi:MAG: acyl-CoA thioesterase [Myxococcaceae bacterium]|nr:MAG: acyl-CoA thioesterase [Myxococcaceae bacterium]
MAGWTTEVTLDVAWGEMDALGHVNNVRYIAWAETARIRFFEQFGMSTHPGDPVGPILARIENDYLQQVEYPARITVGIRPEKVGNTSLTLEHAIWTAGAPERVVARGRAVVVMINYATQEKVRVPEAIRALLSQG